jgi:hypothetical protein
LICTYFILSLAVLWIRIQEAKNNPQK